MVKTLITGFVPFHIFPKNPAEEVAEHLGKRPDFDIRTAVLPVEYGRARELVQKALLDHSPDLVISFGLNGKISHIALEEIAINVRGSEIPDNNGKLSSGESIAEGGALAYRSSLPILDILDGLKKEGIPAKVSYSAGVYLCNEVFYTVMEWCKKSGARGGFIHIPMATELIPDDPKMTSMPHMSLMDLKRGADLILEVSAGIR